MKLFSTEAVSKYHPDKYADQISDAILTECLRQDATSHCGIETLVKDDIVVVSGEIKTEAVIDIPSIVAKVANKLHYPIRCVIDLLGTQSNEINHAVTKAESVGAGDQGIMFGYATAETDSKLPFAFDIANRIIARIEEDVDGNSSSILCGDAKTQVTVDLDTGKITDIVVSVCHKPNYSNAMVRGYVLELLSDIPAPKRWHINPAGKWTVGGPTADCGLTGRKIVCDQYGGFCAVGGGALSGKDPSKVDRTATYMARQIACDLVDKFGLKECTVQLGFVIGSETPISVCVDADSEIDLSAYVKENYDLSVKGMIKYLGLLNQDYESIAEGCHFYDKASGKERKFKERKVVR